MKKSEFTKVQGGEEVVAESYISRHGKHGLIEGFSWATRDGSTGELTFHARLPNVARHLDEDFDVAALVLVWGLWSVAGQARFFSSAQASYNACMFVWYAIERWICEQGKLQYAENGDGDYES